MRKCFLLTCITILFVFCLTSCNPNVSPMTGDPGESVSQLNDFSSIKLSVDEGDIVKSYKDFIIKLHNSGITIIYTNEGHMTKVADYSLEYFETDDIIVHNNFLIAVTTRKEETKDENGVIIGTVFYTDSVIFDLTSLTSEGYDFPVVRTLSLKGSYEVAKALDNTLYIFTSFYGTGAFIEDDIHLEINDNGTKFPIEDNKYLNQTSNTFTTAVAVPLDNAEEKAEAIAFYGDIFEVCLYPGSIYLVFQMSTGTSLFIKLALKSLEYIGNVTDNGYSINNRYCINDDRTNLMIVTTNRTLGSRLTIYNSALERIGRLDGIAPGEFLKGVRYSGKYCYIVTYLTVDPVFKIDLSNISEPAIVDELEITGYSTYLHLLDEINLAIGIGYTGSLSPKISLFNVADDDIEEITSIETTLLLFSFATADPRFIYIDRGSKLIIVTGIGYDTQTAALCDANSTPTDKRIFFNTVVFGYSDNSLLQVKTISTYLAESFSDLLNDKSAMLKWESSRCLIFGKYLYITDNNCVISYDMSNGFSEIEKLNYLEAQVTE